VTRMPGSEIQAAFDDWLANVVLGCADEIEDVAREAFRAGWEASRQQVTRLRAQIREMQAAAERRNRELDALHLVWCDGGCPSGVHRWSDLLVTEELVAAAERNTCRLRRWYTAVKSRIESPAADKWLEYYAKRAAAKTDLLTGQEAGRD
jgi:hypothetical protein